jgi:hypothetical protein
MPARKLQSPGCSRLCREAVLQIQHDGQNTWAAAANNGAKSSLSRKNICLSEISNL